MYNSVVYLVGTEPSRGLCPAPTHTWVRGVYVDFELNGIFCYVRRTPMSVEQHGDTIFIAKWRVLHVQRCSRWSSATHFVYDYGWVARVQSNGRQMYVWLQLRLPELFLCARHAHIHCRRKQLQSNECEKSFSENYFLQFSRLVSSELLWVVQGDENGICIAH